MCCAGKGGRGRLGRELTGGWMLVLGVGVHVAVVPSLFCTVFAWV